MKQKVNKQRKSIISKLVFFIKKMITQNNLQLTDQEKREKTHIISTWVMQITTDPTDIRRMIKNIMNNFMEGYYE